MQVTKKNLTDTNVQLKLTADAELLQAIKHDTLESFAASINLPGFREGKAPLSLVEKQSNQTRLQSEFLERAINHLYSAALRQENLRPVDQPKVNITKFVPYDTLEIEAEVEVVGEIKLADYKKMKLAKEKVTVTAKEIDEVIASLRNREAEKKEVTRAAKEGDTVWIDFIGVDEKTKEPVKGAEGKDYPLLLGSNTFIPGFETNLVGTKAGEEKTFVLTFPKDYGVTALQNRKVVFTTTTNKVEEAIEPKLDDTFAAKVGPFKSVAELKADIKKQLEAEKQYRADQKYADELLTKISEKSKVAIPAVLIDEQIERLERDQRQNILYRGQTWEEYLKSEGLNEKSFRDKQRPVAELRVKAGLVLAEIADQEGITVTPEEIEAQLQALKARYPDAAMQAELEKPETRREIASRLMTEKTLDRLTGYAV
jgi:trigger factor